MRFLCISYYMATTAICKYWHSSDIMPEGHRPKGIMSLLCQYLHMRMRGHVMTNLLHGNGMHFLGDSDVYGHESLFMTHFFQI